MSANSTSDALADRGVVAPTWHTVVLLLILFGFSYASAHAGSLTPFGLKIGRAFGYVLIIIFECAVVAFIWFGTSRSGVRISDLVGGGWARPVYMLRDFLIAVAFLIVAAGVLGALDHFLIPLQTRRFAIWSRRAR